MSVMTSASSLRAHLKVASQSEIDVGGFRYLEDNILKIK
jgi:hypothetical protein